jgi:hypothetical protein
MRRLPSLGAAVISGILVLTGCSASDSGDSFTVVQDVPVLVDHPNRDLKGRIGAVLFFGAVLRDQGGQQIGKVVGEIVTVDVDVDGASDEDRFRKLAFNFDDGQIIALGSSEYVGSDDDQTNFARNNAPVTAVVVGGTDQYQGVSGVVITTKLADGTYEHNFQLQE